LKLCWLFKSTSFTEW